MTDKHVPWGAHESDSAAQSGRPLSSAHGSGIPFRPLPVPPLTAPGALLPLSAQYALCPRLQHGSPALAAPAPPAPAPPAPAFAPPSAPAMPGPAPSGAAFSGYGPPPGTPMPAQRPPAVVSARGGTLPPGMVSQQDVLSASGVYSSNALPFVPAPPSERAPSSQMAFLPAPTTERMGANAVQPPPQAAPQGFASPGFGAAGGTTPPDPARSPLPSLAGVPTPPGPPAVPAPPGPPAAAAPPPALSMSGVAAPGAPPGPSAAAAPPPALSMSGVAAPGAPPAVGGWDGAAAESPWATTSARLEMPALPSALAPDRGEPSRPAAPAAARREAPPREGSGRTLVLVLSVILAVALLALIGISAWQSMRGRGPISIDYTEPPPTTPEVEPAPPATVTAAPRATAAPRPAVRQRPKSDDIYEEAEREINRR
ncbi:uncharacterized protein SOCEGT47_066350 [Sorangium cellulosum]|uniref:Uncharacterized protein n=1 Tax=Sorangium cellulosum TaxID=56 RepID=A0A4P2Q955_SORCE|nr:hypothetical protein [Sorangium cellulosum]AUX26080.1 uncharacterized protein SOCEGT47_066350 [Sorangium cellulosum]